MLPDVIIIGDSHANAIAAGCAALGIRAELLRFSGNFWHSGHVMFHGQHGIWVRGLPDMQTGILQLRERLGGRSVLSRDVPVIACMGYHLGRIVPPFGFNGHVTGAAAFVADPAASYASQALTDAYVDAVRAGHIRMAQRMARHCALQVVVPPRLFAGSNYDRFADVITTRMRAAGVQVCDPSAALFAGQGLPADYISADGVHGNERYGTEAVGLLIAQGALGKRAA